MSQQHLGIVAVVVSAGLLTGVQFGAADEPTAVVAGVVRLDGPAPPPRESELDEAMQRATGDKVYREETWLAGPERGLANCVITLTPEPSAGPVVARPVAGAALEKVGVRYVPRVLVVTPGTEVVLRNQASACRGFQITGEPRYNHLFNYLIREGTEQKITLRGPDLCLVTCPLRPYVRGYIVVVDTPYFAVTDSAGQFSVPGVPPGKYRISVWHEGVGKFLADAGPRQVAVTKAGATGLNFRATPPKAGMK